VNTVGAMQHTSKQFRLFIHHSFFYSLNHSFIQPVIHSLARSLTHSFTESFISIRQLDPLGP